VYGNNKEMYVQRKKGMKEGNGISQGRIL